MKTPSLKTESALHTFLYQPEPPAVYHPALSELNLHPEQLESVLGYGQNNTPAFYKEKLEKMWQEAIEKADIKVGYRILPADQFHWHLTHIQCGEIKFLTGKIISRQLKESETVAVFAGTAGPAFELWSKKLFDQGDFPEGYIADMLGSEIIEAAIDWMEMELQRKLHPLSLKMTNRFSPGYCGWNVQEQFKLFSLLPRDFCGITLTDSALMVPIKSVSGIIGIGETVEKVGYPCDICTMKNCYRRRKSEAITG